MVIVRLPPLVGGAATLLWGSAHRDIQSYSLLHVMELSPHRANGSDPFNLWQKHTDEEVPNARAYPAGGKGDACLSLSPPPGCCRSDRLIH